MSQNADRRPTEPEAPESSTPAAPVAHPAPAPTAPAPTATPVARTRPCELPPYRVLLHNDDDADAIFVVKTLLELTPLDPSSAKTVMWSAHTQGRAIVLVTHQERAELYQEQLNDKGLTVSIEPEPTRPG